MADNQQPGGSGSSDPPTDPPAEKNGANSKAPLMTEDIPSLVKAVADELRPALERNIPGELFRYLQYLILYARLYVLRGSWLTHALVMAEHSIYGLARQQKAVTSQQQQQQQQRHAVLYFNLPLELQLPYLAKFPSLLPYTEPGSGNS